MVKDLSFYTEVPISPLSKDKIYWYFDTGISSESPWPREGWSSSNSHLPQVYRYIFPTRVYLVSEKGRSGNNTYMGVQIYNAETNERICHLYEHVDTIKNFLYPTEKEAQEMMKYSLSELKKQHDSTVGKSLRKVESSLKALKPYV